MIVDPGVVQEFLSHNRIVVVGASDDPKSFGGTIYRELRDHGYDVAAVNPAHDVVAGDPCYPTLGIVPHPIDGAIVMVNRDAALDVVAECVTLGIPRVWLFKGIGSAGAVSDAAVNMCHAHGIEVVPGACPLMFLEPVGSFHKVHRTFRHMNGSLVR
ncbi:MAG: CoA-binding protein [Actinomycetota bacterium]|nr:CoA-binding protein [Actinomycetota bacterium]